MDSRLIRLSIPLLGERGFLHSTNIFQTIFERYDLNPSENLEIDFNIKKQMTTVPLLSSEKMERDESVIITLKYEKKEIVLYLYPSEEAITERISEKDIDFKYSIDREKFTFNIQSTSPYIVFEQFLYVGKKWYPVYFPYGGKLMVRKATFFSDLKQITELTAIKEKSIGNMDMWTIYAGDSRKKIITCAAARME